MNKEYKVRYQFNLGNGKEIDNIGYMVATDTEDLHKKMIPYRYEILSVKDHVNYQ